MSALPAEFQTWLDYALATMDEHREKSVRTADQSGALTYADIQTAALAELDHLRRKAAMPWVGLLEVWQKELSKKLGRSAEDIVANNLQATDFPDESILVQYGDGTTLKFQRAFYLGKVPDDGAIHRIAVFTEHCGYHEFWIGPGSRIIANPLPSSYP